MSSNLPISTVPLAPSTITALTKHGFAVVKDVLEQSVSSLAKELDIPMMEAHEIRKSVQEFLTKGSSASSNSASTSGSASVSASGSGSGGKHALELLETEQRQVPLLTLCRALDDLLGGGITLGQVTEFCGVPGIGKTQMGIQIACNASIPEMFGGLDGAAVYIDTEGSFQASRARQIARGLIETVHAATSDGLRQLEAQNAPSARVEEMRATALAALADYSERFILQRIHYFRIFDYTEQLAVIRSLKTFLQEHPEVRVVVIDSVSFHFRRGFADFALRSRLLQRMGGDLVALAKRFNVAVVLVNQVTTKPNQGAFSPALGNSWQHACANRVMLYWSPHALERASGPDDGDSDSSSDDDDDDDDDRGSPVGIDRYGRKMYALGKGPSRDMRDAGARSMMDPDAPKPLQEAAAVRMARMLKSPHNQPGVVSYVVSMAGVRDVPGYKPVATRTAPQHAPRIQQQQQLSHNQQRQPQQSRQVIGTPKQYQGNHVQPQPPQHHQNQYGQQPKSPAPPQQSSYGTPRPPPPPSAHQPSHQPAHQQQSVQQPTYPRSPLQSVNGINGTNNTAGSVSAEGTGASSSFSVEPPRQSHMQNQHLQQQSMQNQDMYTGGSAAPSFGQPFGMASATVNPASHSATATPSSSSSSSTSSGSSSTSVAPLVASSTSSHTPQSSPRATPIVATVSAGDAATSSLAPPHPPISPLAAQSPATPAKPPVHAQPTPVTPVMAAPPANTSTPQLRTPATTGVAPASPAMLNPNPQHRQQHQDISVSTTTSAAAPAVFSSASGRPVSAPVSPLKPTPAQPNSPATTTVPLSSGFGPRPLMPQAQTHASKVVPLSERPPLHRPRNQSPQPQQQQQQPQAPQPVRPVARQLLPHQAWLQRRRELQQQQQKQQNPAAAGSPGPLPGVSLFAPASKALSSDAEAAAAPPPQNLFRSALHASQPGEPPRQRPMQPQSQAQQPQAQAQAQPLPQHQQPPAQGQLQRPSFASAASRLVVPQQDEKENVNLNRPAVARSLASVSSLSRGSSNAFSCFAGIDEDNEDDDEGDASPVYDGEAFAPPVAVLRQPEPRLTGHKRRLSSGEAPDGSGETGEGR